MLFDNIPKNELEKIHSNSISIQYQRGETIFDTKDSPKCINLLLEGDVNICDYDENGNRKIINNIKKEGDIFGEIFLFINAPYYEHCAEAASASKVLKIPKNIIYENAGLMLNLTSIFASKAYLLNKKISLLSCSTLREKILLYINQNKDASGVFYLSQTKDELADFLNVARPSLSREMIKMKDEGIINIDGKKININ